MKVTAVILAGGSGTRLRSVISDRPKVLAEVKGRPFLAYLLDWLAAARVRSAVFCTGYLADHVREALGAKHGPMSLLYSEESTPLGTGGALRLALPMLDSDPVLVVNGDSFCGLDLKDFLNWHDSQRAVATLVSVWMADAGRYGHVNIKGDGCVLGFNEKGCCSEGWINAGIYLLSRSLLQDIPEGTAVSLEREMFPMWVGRGLYGYRTNQPFLDIGTPESYAEAKRFFL